MVAFVRNELTRIKFLSTGKRKRSGHMELCLLVGANRGIADRVWYVQGRRSYAIGLKIVV